MFFWCRPFVYWFYVLPLFSIIYLLSLSFFIVCSLSFSLCCHLSCAGPRSRCTAGLCSDRSCVELCGVQYHHYRWINHNNGIKASACLRHIVSAASTNMSFCCHCLSDFIVVSLSLCFLYCLVIVGYMLFRSFIMWPVTLPLALTKILLWNYRTYLKFKLHK